LAAGKHHAFFADDGIVAFRLFDDECMSTGRACGRFDLGIGHSVAAGGNVGLAARRASLAGSDSSFVSIIPGTINVSSISTGQTTTPFLANAEASLAFRLARAWSLRTFVGLDYDSKVPGIAAPTVVVGGGTSTAAGIKFQSETSYYAGGGLTMEF